MMPTYTREHLVAWEETKAAYRELIKTGDITEWFGYGDKCRLCRTVGNHCSWCILFQQHYSIYQPNSCMHGKLKATYDDLYFTIQGEGKASIATIRSLAKARLAALVKRAKENGVE